MLAGSSLLALVLAAAAPELQLEIDSCAEVDAGEVGRVVAVELRAPLVTEARDGTTEARVSCRGSFFQVRVDEPESQKVVVSSVVERTLLELRVDDPLTGKSLRRVVDLHSETPRARQRLLALALSELVRASWLELAANPSPQVPPVGKVAAPDLARAAEARARPGAHPSLAARCGALALASEPKEPLWSCGLELALSGELLRAGITLDFATARTEHSLGHVSRSANTGLLYLGASFRSGALGAFVDLGARLGVVSVAGHARPSSGLVGNALAAAWGGPALRLTGSFWLERRLGLSVALEGGYALLGPEGRALGAVAADTLGPFAQATLGALLEAP